MSKVTVAFASFIVGACCAIATFSVIHASTQAQVPKNEPVNMIGAEPTIPPLSAHIVGGVSRGPSQTLDGLDCGGCTIEVDVITYGGGAFSCRDCTIHASRVNLTGAAQNTYNALRFFGIIQSPKPAPRMQDRTMLAFNEVQLVPQEQKASAQKEVDWISLAGLQK